MARPDVAPGATSLLLRELALERRRALVAAAVLTVAQTLPLIGPLLLHRFVDRAGAGAPSGALVSIALGYLGVGVGAQVLAVASAATATTLAWAVTDRIRNEVAGHVLGLDMAFHNRRRPGEMIERVDGDVTLLSQFFGTFAVSLVGSALLLLGSIVAVLLVDPLVALAIVVTTAATAAVIPPLQRRATPLGAATREADAQATATLEERLAGLDDIRANGGGAAAVAAYEDAAAATVTAAVRSERAGAAVYAASTIVFGAGATAALLVAVLRQRAGAISVGAVLAVFQYTVLVRQPIRLLVDQLKVVQDALAGATRLASLLTERSDMLTGDATLPPGPLGASLRGVTFGYGDDDDVLRDVDLEIEPGSILGLVGRSGGGKTTIARLVLRLWDPRSGTVEVGGVDVRTVVPDVLRARLAYVTQDVQLFRASVRDNLTLFGELVDDAAVFDALHRVGLGAWARALPDGLDTMIGGDGGTGLSAGEQQLLALARAFLRSPGLVVLDEASSRLDPVTEAAVEQAVGQLLAGRTGIVIAHRPGALRAVTHIAVVEDNRITRVGRRDDVVASLGPRLALLFDQAPAAEVDAR